jgi:hypothetical protein
MRLDRGMEGSVNTSGVEVGSGVGGEVSAVVDTVGREKGVAVGVALCILANAVLAVDMAVFITFSGLSVGVDGRLLQDVNITIVRSKRIFVLPKLFTFSLLFDVL